MATKKAKPIPSAEIKEKEKPIVGIPENTVTICGQQIEIKPTKVKYQRDRTAALTRKPSRAVKPVSSRKERSA